MTDRANKTANQSTQMAFRIMEEMAVVGEGIRLTDLAHRLSIPKPRAHRYLQTLMAIGYVAQDPTNERYQLTLKLFHLGQAVADSTDFLMVARPVMHQLRDETEQTVTLSALEAKGMRVLQIVRTKDDVQIITKPGALLKFHASAQGKLALAFGGEGPWQAVRAGPLEALTERTNTNVDVLANECEVVRAQRYAVAPEETLAGVNAVSAPIFDASADFIGTITIAGSVARIPPEPHPGQRDQVVRAGRIISQHLGHQDNGFL